MISVIVVASVGCAFSAALAAKARWDFVSAFLNHLVRTFALSRVMRWSLLVRWGALRSPPEAGNCNAVSKLSVGDAVVDVCAGTLPIVGANVLTASVCRGI